MVPTVFINLKICLKCLQFEQASNHIQNDGANKQQEASKEDGVDDSYLYRIKTSDLLGRYLVAARALPEGATVVSEDALVVGPAQDCLPACLGCYKLLTHTPNLNRCDKCQWPLCSSKCKGLHKRHGHSEEECLMLSKCDFDNTALAGDQLTNAVVPLRCLRLKACRPELWETLRSMEAHNDVRRTISSIWDHNQKSVVDRIRKDWKITEFTEEEIHTVCGILEVNAFSVGDDTLNIRALYPTAFLMAHSCVANTAHVDEDQFRMRVFTSVPVPQDQMLTLSYTNTLLGTRERRKHLKQCKFFDCECARCSDPAELGTLMSAVSCECGRGQLLPRYPLADDAQWACSDMQCDRSQPAHHVTALVNRIDNAIRNLDHNSINDLEAGIKQYSGVLHKTHYHIIGMKYALSQLYGKHAGYLIHQMSDTLLERKIQVCEDVLQIFNVVEPGLTRVRALTMYELHAPLMILTINKFETRKISKVDLSRRLRRVASCLRDCSRILKLDTRPPDSGSIGVAAEEALAQLKTWQQVVGKL